MTFDSVFSYPSVTSDSVFSCPGLEPGQRGIFWDGDTSHPWMVLGHQLAGIVAISAWSMGWSAIVFGTLKYAGGNIGLLGGKENDNS